MTKQTKVRANPPNDMSGTAARSTLGTTSQGVEKSQRGSPFEKLKATEELAGQMLANENKAREYGKEAATQPKDA